MTVILDDAELSYSELTSKIREEVSNRVVSRERILLLAKKLEQDLVKKDEICSQITRDLGDVISDRYIRKVLPDEYKRPYSKPNRNSSELEEEKKVEMFADGSTTPEFNTKGMGVTITDDESESSSESATGSQGQEIEQEVEQPKVAIEDFKAMYHEVVCTNKELNEEIEDNHKAMEEMRKEVKALMAKNPTLGANPDIIQNQHNEIKKLLAENDLLRKSQKPIQFHTSDELSTTSSEINDVIAPHKILGEIYKLIPTTRDHGDLKFRIEDGKIIGVEVINFAA